jgi:hypothetical protein
MVGSGEWFIKGVEFEAWIQGQKPYLWLNGIRGFPRWKQEASYHY